MQRMEKPLLSWSDMPEVVRALDMAAIRLQRAYQRAASAQLLLFLLASILSSISWIRGRLDAALLGAALCFGLAIAVQIGINMFGWEERWKDIRRGTEQVSSLVYTYAFGGEPFSLVQGDPKAADLALVEAVAITLSRLPTLESRLSVTGKGAESDISMGMRAVRAMSLNDRIASYVSSRVEDQGMWYRRRAMLYRRRATLWNALTLSIQAIALGALIAQGFGMLRASVFGVASAIGGAGAAYAQNRQYRTLGREYALNAHKLAAMREGLALNQAYEGMSEGAWAEIVRETEAQILDASR